MTDPAAIVLTVETGPCRGRTTVVRAAQAVLGRDPDADLSLADDSTVSRRHASLSWEGGQWLLRDLASKNGTFVAVAPQPEAIVTPRPVAPGSRFLLGSALIAVSRAETPSKEPVRLRIGLSEGTLDFQLESGAAIAVGAACPFALAQVDSMHRGLNALLATAEATGADIDAEFLGIGAQLAKALLPGVIQEHLMATAGRPLALVLDPGLIGIAWEAICLSGAPICLARPVSRTILVENAAVRPQEYGGRFLIVANPTGDLPRAQRQGEELLDFLVHENALFDVHFLAGRRATLRNVISAMARCDVLVYLGHAEHAAGGGGWRLADGLLDARQPGLLDSVPELVVAGACESARETPADMGSKLLPEGTGMATAFLRGGTRQYVGTLWRVPVVSGTAFATVLLNSVLAGVPLGDAMLRARLHLRDVLHAPAHVCAGHVHYGAPEWVLRRRGM